MPSSLDVAKKLGLNEYESKAYVSLLSYGTSSASKISSASSIPRARVYDVLVSLEKKGFVEKKLVRPITYSAVLPSVAVKKLESVHRRGFEESINELVSIASSLEKQVSSSPSQDERGEVVLVSGWQNIFSKISQIMAESKNEVLFCTTSPENVKSKKKEFSRIIGELEKKGVKVKFKVGPFRYVLFDDGKVLLFLNQKSPGFSNEKALLLENQFVASFFAKK